jgi:hypothetical protein
MSNSSSTTGAGTVVASSASTQQVATPPDRAVDDLQTSLLHEKLPRLTRPTGEPARGIPSWDLEPPAFLVKRGERA